MLRTILFILIAVPTFAQDSRYFVTYDHHLEDKGDLEISVSSTVGVPRSEQRAFVAPYAEAEYGVRRWWTSSLYFEGQSTAGESAVFTGWRFENRFRLLAHEHAVNPVFYIEYESLNEASRIEKEIVGTAPLLDERNNELSQTHAHEIETRLSMHRASVNAHAQLEAGMVVQSAADLDCTPYRSFRITKETRAPSHHLREAAAIDDASALA